MASIEIAKNKYKIEQNFFIHRLQRIVQKLKLKGNISIKIGSRSEAIKLNFKYRGKNQPTDVLSFPIHQQLPEGYYLGDIFVCVPIAREQAMANRIPLKNELLRLMIHGVLHLAGYDHEQDNGQMSALQERLLVDLLNP